MTPAADGRMRVEDGPFQGYSLEDFQRPPPNYDEVNQISEARLASLSNAHAFTDAHGPAYERIILSELSEWFVHFPSPPPEQVVLDALSIVSLLAHSVESALDTPEEVGTSSSDWYQAIASGVTRLASQPNALANIDEGIGGNIKNIRSPSGFVLMARELGAHTQTSEEAVHQLWKFLMTALVVGPDIDDYDRGADRAHDALLKLLSRQSTEGSAGIAPQAHKRRELHHVNELSAPTSDIWGRRMAWLSDERAFTEDHVSLYIHVVVEGLDKTLYQPSSQFYGSSETSKLYDALTWAVPLAISLSEAGTSVEEIGTDVWRREIADGVGRMRVDREALYEVSRQTDKLVDIAMGSHHKDPDRVQALVMSVRPALAFLAGQGEGLNFDNGDYNPEWDYRFEARLVEAESAARQALSS